MILYGAVSPGSYITIIAPKLNMSLSIRMQS
jgi:hypothetical protein